MNCPRCSAEMQDMNTNNALNLIEIPSGSLICPVCFFTLYTEPEPTADDLASLDLSFLQEEKQNNSYEECDEL